MNVRIIYFCMCLFSVGLIGCQAEDAYVKHKDYGVKSGVQIKRLSGIEAKKAENLLKSELQKSGGLNLGSNQSNLRGNQQEIDYDNILMVLDTLGIRNYTFKILNHPDDNNKIFHNLVLTEKNNHLEVAVMKYEMTDLFAEEYSSFLKTFYEFEGKISALGFSTALDPCSEITVDYPVSEPNPDNGNGNGLEPPSPPNAPGPGEGSGNSGGSSWCVSMVLHFVCSCGRSYSSWGDYQNSICGDGSNPGFTVTMVISYSLDSNCRSAGEPCSPDGMIGVINDKDCNRFEKRIRNILDAEGGFVNDPSDPGGATNKGISWKVWQANAYSLLGIEPTLENLQSLTDNQAKIMYKALYWDKIECDDITDGDLRYLLFDFYVNAGGNAVKELKKTLNSLGYNLTVDSQMDYETINTINNHTDIVTLYNKFKIARKEYYNDLVNKSIARYVSQKPNATEQQIKAKTLKKYLDGWHNRTNKFQNKTVQNPINVNC